MKLILARHGNTFDDGQIPTWVGSKNDLPLVEKGKAQAEALADYLVKNSIKPDAVYCGPLKRTKEYAQIICENAKLNLEPIIDERLNEIDYGEWSGLTNKEISEKFGDDVLCAWNDFSIWPEKEKGNWGTSKQKLLSNVNSFVEGLSQKYSLVPASNDKTILAVSSNGVLRHFGLIFGNKTNAKVKPGNICITEITNKKLEILSWDISSAELKKT